MSLLHSPSLREQLTTSGEITISYFHIWKCYITLFKIQPTLTQAWILNTSKRLFMWCLEMWHFLARYFFTLCLLVCFFFALCLFVWRLLAWCLFVLYLSVQYLHDGGFFSIFSFYRGLFFTNFDLVYFRFDLTLFTFRLLNFVIDIPSYHRLAYASAFTHLSSASLNKQWRKNEKRKRKMRMFSLLKSERCW